MQRILWIIALIASALIAALGVLWFAQGIGLITIDPVACVGACEPVEAPDLLWIVLGLAVAGAGSWLFWIARRKLRDH